MGTNVYVEDIGGARGVHGEDTGCREYAGHGVGVGQTLGRRVREDEAGRCEDPGCARGTQTYARQGVGVGVDETRARQVQGTGAGQRGGRREAEMQARRRGQRRKRDVRGTR